MSEQTPPGVIALFIAPDGRTRAIGPTPQAVADALAAPRFPPWIWARVKCDLPNTASHALRGFVDFAQRLEAAGYRIETRAIGHGDDDG